MDQAKKQKVMLGVLVVALLGMGTVWYFGRDADSRGTTAVKQTGARKKRAGADGVKKKAKGRATRKTAKRVKATAERRQRETKVRDATKERKTRKRSTKKKKKKKSFAPAA